MRLSNKIICVFIGFLAATLVGAILILTLQMDTIEDRDACNQAYERELARLKTWREEQLAKLVELSEEKRLEAQLVIDYTLQVAAGKLQGAIMSRNGEECKSFRMGIWPEGIEKIGLWLNLDAIRFAVENFSWRDAAQADDATLKFR